jgi:hypothetical protein
MDIIGGKEEILKEQARRAGWGGREKCLQALKVGRAGPISVE